jgi:hypothetical protein
MNEDEEKIQKASEVLKNHRIGEIAKAFLNYAYRFDSMPTLTFTRCTKLSGIDSDVNGVMMTHDGDELAIATTEFEISAAPDSSTFYADGLITYNSEVVLKVTTTKEYDEYGSDIDFSIYPHAIKSMKAGSWLNMMGSCYDMLEADAKRREEEDRMDRDRKQASNIDLGDY